MSPQEEIDNSKIDYRTSSDNPLNLNWEAGSYLVFSNSAEIKNTYDQLKTSFNDENYYILDSFEDQNDFFSMRRTYDEYEEKAFSVGWNPKQVSDIPIINDVLSSMLSVDGLVQVGNEIQYFSSDVNAKAPISEKNRLKQIITEGEIIRPTDVANGIEVTTRGGGAFCPADFNVSINHATFEVDIVYTGETPNGEDKNLTWNIGTNNANQLNFTHQYSGPGNYEICATFTEREIFTDTVFYYLEDSRDSTYRLSNGSDTTVTIPFITEKSALVSKVRIGCTSTICKNIEIGGCTADFSFNIGIDNVVNFVNQSSSAYGQITGYLWNFGDGDTSTLVNPTHIYECDRDYEVNLIVFSPQCPNGQAVATPQSISASGINCCDSNPSSKWRDQEHPTDENKMIKYKYDMGSEWEWLNDQDFKAKIKYLENRSGGLFGGTQWRNTNGLLDVDFAGDVYAADEDDCKCQDPRDLSASPPNKTAKKHTFKDPLDGTALSSDKVWLKQSSPVYIDWKVDGVLYLRQQAQLDPAFKCD